MGITAREHGRSFDRRQLRRSTRRWIAMTPRAFGYDGLQAPARHARCDERKVDTAGEGDDLAEQMNGVVERP